MQGRHHIWGRVEPELLAVTTAEQRTLIAQVRLQRAQGMKTIFDAFHAGQYLGQVRTTFGGQFFRRSPNDEFNPCGFQWNPDVDPPHALAILSLIEP